MGIEQDLQQAKVTTFDLSDFITVETGTSIRTTVAKMRVKGCNCAFITRNGKLAGVFTDRDILRSVVDRPDIWDHGIDEVMTHEPHTLRADQTAGEALRMMEFHHFRNMPVIDEKGAIVGNLTHFSVIHYLAESFPQEVLNLPPEPDVFGEERFGG